MKKIYSYEEKQLAIKTFNKTKSYVKTIRLLGYPSRHVLFDWVKYGIKPKKPKKQAPPKSYSYRFKSKVVKEYLNNVEISYLAQKYNITNEALIYKGASIGSKGGDFGLMSNKEKERSRKYKTRKQIINNLPNNKQELKALAAKLMVKNAVLEEELKMSKKSKGSIPEQLRPKTKTKIAYKLSKYYPVKMLLNELDLPESTYYYGVSVINKPDKYGDLRKKIWQICRSSNFTYGSPRIGICLRNDGICVSEKVVRRIKKEEKIPVYYPKQKRKYSSYVCEITPAPDNIVNRNFHSTEPNKLGLTDITEFAVKTDKLYLSPIIDCFDGKVIAYNLARRPTIELVENMINKGLAAKKCW